MALAKATPVKAHTVMADGLRDQAPLAASEQPGDIGGEI
jgi:hypothetical protein